MIVGPKGFPRYSGPELGSTYGSSHVTGEPAGPEVHHWGNQFPLDDTTVVRIGDNLDSGQDGNPHDSDIAEGAAAEATGLTCLTRQPSQIGGSRVSDPSDRRMVGSVA